MRTAALLALLMVTGGLAGCIGGDQTEELDTEEADEPAANLSKARFDVREVEVVPLETDDGKILHNAVYRPATDEPVPVFINFSPYWGDTATERGDNFAQYMIEEYVPRGYAVVLAAIRGTGYSEGCFRIGGDTEVADLTATVEHFAGVDWSNGNVIAGGKSYDSTPQNGMIAKDAPEGLAGLFHVSGITDMYRYTYRNGVPYSHGAIFNTYYYGQSLHEYGVIGAPEGSAGHEDEDADSLSRAIDDAACPELPEMQANGVSTAAHGMKTDYWTERDWNRYVADSDWNGSIFFVHGLQDWNVKPDHILPWLDELPDGVDVKGWLHQDVEDGTGHVYPMRADWNRTMLAWLDQVGKGKDTGVEHVFEVEGDDDVWRKSETWPPSDATTETVGVEDASAETSDEGVERVEGPLALEGPHRYAGQPVVRANVTVEANADPVFTAVLYERGPGGELTWINEGVLRGLHRDGLAQPEPVPQGETLEVEIPMYPQDDVLEEDREWVLALGEVPRFTMVTDADLRGVDYPDDGAAIELPTGQLDTALETQPEPIGCFAC